MRPLWIHIPASLTTTATQPDVGHPPGVGLLPDLSPHHRPTALRFCLLPPRQIHHMAPEFRCPQRGILAHILRKGTKEVGVVLWFPHLWKNIKNASCTLCFLFILNVVLTCISIFFSLDYTEPVQRYTQKFTMDMGAPDNAVIEFSTATGGQSIYYKAVVTNEFYDMLVANHVVEYNSTTGKHTERIERIEGDALISGKSQWVFLDFAPSSENSVTRWIVHPDGDDDDYDEESKTWVYIYREKRIQP